MSTVRTPPILRFLRKFCTESRSPLNDFHLEHGAKMVNFGGFLLPVQYSDVGIAASHLHTRKKASLFDVSHMMQTEVTGGDCIQYLESICTADLVNLKENAATLTVFTNDNGGILDDLIVTKILNDHLYIVSNAARRSHDQNHMLKALELHKRKNPTSDIKLRFFAPAERALLALQGPQSSQSLQKLTSIDLKRLYFMNSTIGDVAGVQCCRITRCGYTGEDGFEISIPSIKATDVSRELLNVNKQVKLAGLGARDSLRLEAGLCLYGSDIDESTTPIEAGLAWLVAKRRRQLADFPGASTILRQLGDGVERRRVGLVSASAAPPARHGAEIVDGDEVVGKVTSGCPSPSLGVNVAMGYVARKWTAVGTRLGLKIRGKTYEAEVVKMPFIKVGYYTEKK